MDQQVDSARAPFSMNTTYLLSIQFEGISSTTGKPVLVGTASKMTVNLLNQSFILADVPGNKTTTVTASSLRATVTITGLVGWDQVAAVAFRSKPFAPFAIAPGQKVGCRYDMPAQTFNITKLAFGSAGSGRLRCQPGVLAASIPAPVVQAPAPTPAPTPVPPTVTTSPDGTKIPPATQVIATDGAIWTMGAAVGGASPVLRAAIRVGDGVALCKSGGSIFVQDTAASGGLWQRWLNPGWSAHVPTPAGC